MPLQSLMENSVINQKRDRASEMDQCPMNPAINHFDRIPGDLITIIKTLLELLWCKKFHFLKHRCYKVTFSFKWSLLIILFMQMQEV